MNSRRRRGSTWSRQPNDDLAAPLIAWRSDFVFLGSNAGFAGNKAADRASYPGLSQSLSSFENEAALEAGDLLQQGYRYALALSHHPHDAEDLVQEAWLGLSRRYGSTPSRGALCTAVRNLFIDRYRRSKLITFENLDEGAAEKLSAARPTEGVRDDLEQLLRHLRPVEREAIFLHHIEGRTADEIGALTQCSRNTVLSLLHRGMKKLQQTRR